MTQQDSPRSVESQTNGLSPLDCYLFAQSTHFHLPDKMGAQVVADGTWFALWAPHASRISVVGDFNHWDETAHPLHRLPDSGLWQVFIAHAQEGMRYKYQLWDANGARLPLKADPYGFRAQLRPDTASEICDISHFAWHDADYLKQRDTLDSYVQPISIYEVHLGSWQHGDDGGFLSYGEIAAQLIPYVKNLGFTHIELLPIMEHPLDASWGYQPVGLYAPTARHGTPTDFAHFVDVAHAHGIGVILDWVPAHFPTDAHGLAAFDGTTLYEHADRQRGFHPDWNTAIYDFGRGEVAGFLINNALFWLERYHLDGLRVDAVASMLHLNYSRNIGEWTPNQLGGEENLEAIAFIRKLNAIVHERVPSALMIAEESTSFPKVSQKIEYGGLGFDFKWDLGFMHDTLDYLEMNPLYRQFHHDKMTFNQMYAHNEHFVLPLSHDEVVHGKSALLHKMHGDDWQKFATLRAYYAWMWLYPGKKLLFMGQEFGQRAEWDEDRALDWHLTQFPEHAGLQQLVGDLNHLYRNAPTLYRYEHSPQSFAWCVVNDAPHSVFAWLRHPVGESAPNPNEVFLVLVNFTPEPRETYTLAVPFAGAWEECLNTDAVLYGGTGRGNLGQVMAKAITHHKTAIDKQALMTVCLPPLATVVLRYSGAPKNLTTQPDIID